MLLVPASAAGEAAAGKGAESLPMLLHETAAAAAGLELAAGSAAEGAGATAVGELTGVEVLRRLFLSTGLSFSGSVGASLPSSVSAASSKRLLALEPLLLGRGASQSRFTCGATAVVGAGVGACICV